LVMSARKRTCTSKQAKLLRKREAFIYMHTIAKGQTKCARGTHPSVVDQLYELAT
jgi:hypothetical protein